MNIASNARLDVSKYKSWVCGCILAMQDLTFTNASLGFVVAFENVSHNMSVSQKR